MFDLFNFELLQMRYVKAAKDALPTFRPDEKTPANVQAMIDAAVAVRTDYSAKQATYDLANGEFKEAVDAGHLACIQVYPIMKSRYRKDPGSLDAINKLPTADQTSAQTIDRMKSMSALWAQLPNPPGSATPFKAWDTMDRTAFDALLAAITTPEAALPGVAQPFELAEAALRNQRSVMEEFVTAALIQGRAQFPEGTPSREVIDAIPTEPAQQPPGQAVISVAESPGAGQAHLAYDTPHATTWDVLHKGPGDAGFAVVADDVIVKVYDTTGLAAGTHEYKVIGRNSRGNGAESAVGSVEVG